MSATSNAGRRPIATILLVDDERRVTQALSALLRKEPYEILCAHSADEALAVMRRRQVDVLVSDEHMPGTSGSQLLAEVAAHFPGTARILLTGNATLEVALRAINDGKICRLLRKPCSAAELTAALFEAIRGAWSATAAERLLAVARSVEASRASSDDPPVQVSRSDSLQGKLGALELPGVDQLSAREQEVLLLLLDGQRVQHVAKTLFISPHTVRNHLKAIFEKLGVHSQAELLALSRSIRRS